MGGQRRGGDLFIVDNGDADWKVSSYLTEWCELSSAIDIATGYFEIGALLCLTEKWQSVDHIRILMGDEVSYKTKRAFERGLQKISDLLEQSMEAQKAKDDFLEGVPAIVQAIKSGKIECRVYRHEKFHAKAYITHGRAAVLGSYALVGSSNFTYPGLNDNIELNVQITGTEVSLLQEWYDRHWEEAVDVTPDMLRVLERHTAPRTPFEIWFKALDEFFRGRELEPDAWDQQSPLFRHLDKYQQDAYRNLLTIAGLHNMAFLCDGVGLGKTYVGLMLIERLVFKEGKQVVLFAPKATRQDVWEPALRTYLGKVFNGFVNLKVYNHTDLQKPGHWPQDIELTVRDADVIIIDEAHHFRNPGIKGEKVKAPSRYRLLQRYLQDENRTKQLYCLTATPINNSIHDFRHMIELYTGGTDNYFGSSLGINSLRGHFVGLEKEIIQRLALAGPLDLTDVKEVQDAECRLRSDAVFEALVVQRSREYVKQSQILQGSSSVLFPEREAPKVVPYSLKATYGRLLDIVRTAFKKENPLFVLGVYYPWAYWRGDKSSPAYEPLVDNRQKQVVMLIRTLFLKRFESSAKAFEGSCWRLLVKLLAWVTVHAESEHDRQRLARWQTRHADLLVFVQQHVKDLLPDEADEDEVEEFLSEDILGDVKKLDPLEFNVDAILDDTFDDLDQLADFLKEVSEVKPAGDAKLMALINLLKSDPVLCHQKVIIFTEFADTARYLERELGRAGISGLRRIDGGSSQNVRSDAIHGFSPYYNGLSSAKLAAQGKSEIRVLISTDVLSEGLNLQDATRLINYDLHWNPVRLMQRIGRVDRRMNPAVESRMLADHPELAPFRRKVAFWNFLPPSELNDLLRLFERVTNKVMVISRTFGIQGRKIISPDDHFDPIKEMNEQCDGTLSDAELLRLEYNTLLEKYPDMAKALPDLPRRVFSGKTRPNPGARAVFFCYRIPRPDPALIDTESGEPRWSDGAGLTVWLCYDLDGNRVLTDPAPIANLIRSTWDTPRHCTVDRQQLSELRKSVEKHLTIEYLKPMQAPIGVSPILKCWMELN